VLLLKRKIAQPALRKVKEKGAPLVFFGIHEDIMGAIAGLSLSSFL